MTTTDSAVRSLVLPSAILTVSSAGMRVPVPTGPAGAWPTLLSSLLPASSTCFAGLLTMSNLGRPKNGRCLTARTISTRRSIGDLPSALVSPGARARHPSVANSSPFFLPRSGGLEGCALMVPMVQYPDWILPRRCLWQWLTVNRCICITYVAEVGEYQHLDDPLTGRVDHSLEAAGDPQFR